jgi:uncharacterized protein (DUF1800 family)
MAMNPQARPAIALNRFGLGARPDDAPPPDAARHLLGQMERYEPRPTAWTDMPVTASVFAGNLEARQNMRDQDEQARRDAQQAMRRDARDDYQKAVQARVQSALVTPTPFVERLVHFWSNHFAVSVEKALVTNLAGPLELEAIRPNVLGRFEDMLMAVERHPAMLIYLDQARSIGPGSPAGVRANANPDRQRGLNENLAREIMELHTLGVRSGYTQADVTEFARALTGWSVGGLNLPQRAQAMAPGTRRPTARRETMPPPPPAAPGSFAFYPALHEPGSRTVMGRRYDGAGEAQGVAILRDLAASPATAKHIATKLARHFVADAPPPALVDRLADVFLRTRGDLPSLYRALIESPEAWDDAAVKFKTPWEWTLSSLRAMGRQAMQGIQVAQILTQLGQPVWRPGSPAGYDDIAASWAAPDALVRRVELAQRLAARAGDSIDPRAIAPKVLPGTLSDATRQAIARSESGATGLALLLVSPDFLRR